MTIKFTQGAFDTIMSACKEYVRKDDLKPKLCGILLQVRGHAVTAYASNGDYNAIRVTVPCDSAEFDGEMWIPWIRPFGKSTAAVVIGDDGDYVIIAHDTGTLRFVKPPGDYINLHLIDSPLSMIPLKALWVNPNQLIKILTAFKGEQRVKLGFHGDKKAFTLNTDTKSALLMPLSPPKQEQKQ